MKQIRYRNQKNLATVKSKDDKARFKCLAMGNPNPYAVAITKSEAIDFINQIDARNKDSVLYMSEIGNLVEIKECLESELREANAKNTKMVKESDGEATTYKCRVSYEGRDFFVDVSKRSAIQLIDEMDSEDLDSHIVYGDNLMFVLIDENSHC